MRSIEEFKDSFIEKEEMPSKKSNFGFLRMFHNCDPGGERLKITFFDNLNGQYIDDYIVLQQETFNAIQNVFREIIVGFDELNSVNPLKDYEMAVAFQKCCSIIEDLNEGIVTDQLKRYLNHMAAELLDESIESITWHTADGNVHRDDEKYWSIIIEHREKIINFFNAFFYYIFDVMDCLSNTFDGYYLINIAGNVDTKGVTNQNIRKRKCENIQHPVYPFDEINMTEYYYCYLRYNPFYRYIPY